MNLEKLSFLVSDFASGKGVWLKQQDAIESYHERIPLQEARHIFREKLGAELSTHKINDQMKRHAENHHHTMLDFEIDRNVIHFANCVYLIDENIAIFRKFGDIDKQLYAVGEDKSVDPVDFNLDEYNVKTLYVNPYEYNPTAKVPVEFIDFVTRVLDNNNDKISQLLEFCGYCLTNSVQYKKAGLFFGETDTGKSTLAKIIMHVVDNFALESIADITRQDKNFNRASLYHKKLNYDDEGGRSSIKNADHFKKLTGLDKIHIERKGEQGFQALNTCKILVSANQLGEVDVLDEAFARRWLIFEFNRAFTRDEIEADKGAFLERMKKTENIEGLIRLFITNLRVLHDRGQFNHQEENLEFWRMHSDIVYRYVKEFCAKERDPHFMTECSEVYDDFIAYAETQPENPINSQNMFTRRMKAIGIKQVDTRAQGKHVKCYNVSIQ